MQLTGRQLLDRCVRKHANARGAIGRWRDIALRANWKTVQELKADFPAASILADNKVVFNIKSNDFRLVVVVFYRKKFLSILWIGTHAEYDRIDVRALEVPEL